MFLWGVVMEALPHCETTAELHICLSLCWEVLDGQSFVFISLCPITVLNAFCREDAKVGDTWECDEGQTLAVEEWDIVMRF